MTEQQTLDEEMDRVSNEVWAKLESLYDQYVRAWLAETGLMPSECEIVTEHRGDEIVTFVRKRDCSK